MNRFTDIDLDNKNLNPISGYWSYPLIPLEQTLEPFLGSIQQLDRSIKAAKKYCHYPSEHGLTKDESAAVYLYTIEGGDNSFYRIFNEALRTEDRREIKPWFPYLKLLETALDKLPTVRGNIWRCVSGDIRKKFKKNQVLTWWSVSSCSLSTEIIEEFLTPGTISTLFMIEAINGKNVAGYTAFPNEHEVMLGVGTQLRVKSNALKHRAGLYVVHLVEVTDESDEKLSETLAAMYVTSPLSKKDTVRGSNKAGAQVGNNKSNTSVPQSAASTNTLPIAQRKVGDCRGNACARCGKCTDWHRVGGTWQRRPRAKCLFVDHRFGHHDHGVGCDCDDNRRNN